MFNLSIQMHVAYLAQRLIASLHELYSKFLFSSSMTIKSTINYEYIRLFAAASFAYL
jgi:hypothetical protein